MSIARHMDEIEQALAVEPSSEDDELMQRERVLSAMEALAAAGALRDLAERFGGDDRGVAARALCFLLAQEANRDAEAARDGVLAAARRFRCDDDVARSNLLTAVQRLIIHGALPVRPGEGHGAVLHALLVSSFSRSELAQTGAATVLADLVLRRKTWLFSAEEHASLRAVVRALQPPPGSLLEDELGAMREFVDGS
jgi:hypothetical protein